MANCECLETCPFFNEKMQNMPATADILKKTYCESDNRDCARYIVFIKKGKPCVPDDLFPNQKEIALRIIKE